MIKLGNFALEVPQGRFLDGGYVELQHATVYTLRLHNAGTRRADASVSVDGTRIGTFRIPPQGVIEMEHPVHDTGRFTFYQLGSAESAAAEIKRNTEAGLITVVFTPERPRATLASQSLLEASLGVSEMIDSHGAGGTGLSGQSFQEYQSAEGRQLPS
jgi:hypothetical protein